MGYIVRMPKLGLEMERGVLLEWHVDEGESVSAGDLVAEVESEKSVGEIEAREDGTLRRTYLSEGETVPPGTPIGIVAPPDEGIAGLESEAEADLEGDAVDEPTAAEGEATANGDGAAASAERSESPATAGEGGRAETDDGVRASPRARERAEELGVDLATVEGTGYQGSITEDDVERAAEAAESGPDSDSGPAAAVDASPRARRRAEELGVDLSTVEGTGYQGAVTEEDVEAAASEASGTAASGAAERTLAEERPFDGMRRTIASRLGESYREAVHVTVHREADAEALFAAVDAADAALETEVSVQDLLLRAVSATLDEHPAFNATFEDEVHELWREHNVGVAVDVEQGLVAPVLPDVGSKSLAEIADERRALVDRALRGDYAMDDLQGGTFTVTNLGVLGVESFDPIINPPQVAILGVDAVSEEPVRSDDGGTGGGGGAAADDLEWRRRLPFDLSFDHRVVDGADAARFLETLVEYVEDPRPLLPDDVDIDAEIGGDALESVDGTGTAGAADGRGEPQNAQTDAEMPGRTVTAENPAAMRGRIRAGSFEWPYDEPESQGGTETGPTPVDVFLGGLASCLSLSARYQAEKRDAAVDEISVTTDAAPERGSVERIEATIRLASDEDDDTLERIVDLAERGCHVSQLLREDLELDLSWDRL